MQSETIKGFFSSNIEISVFEGKLALKKPNEPKQIIDELPATAYVEVSRSTIEQKSDIIIQPQDFNLKAGWSGGLCPRPDTYIISGEVEYHLNDKLHYKQINIEVSIFPSLGTMLIGTLIGSSLGTIVNAIIPHIQNNKVPIPGLEIITLQLFANLVIGFVVAITLMRKKDVQPFLTVEDFLGRYTVGIPCWLCWSGVPLCVSKNTTS